MGSFGKINPFIIKGKNVDGALLTFDTLYFEQPGTGTYYPLLAKNITVEEDTVNVYLDERASFHDGTKVTAEDLVVTINVLKDHGLPHFSHYLKSLSCVTIIDTHTVKLQFKNQSEKTFSFIAGLPILSNRQLKTIKDFSNCQHTKLLGTGPYMIHRFHLGKNIQFKRNAHYWGKDLLIRKGKFNFDFMNIDYYKDYTSLFESFKKGYFDILFDTDPLHFLNMSLPSQGFKKIEFLYDNPYRSIQTLLLNDKRPFLRDKKVRQALAQTFDFGSINRMFFHNRMAKANGIFDQTPSLNPSLSAEELLEKAGYTYKKGERYRVNKKGEILELYVLIRRHRFEKVLNVFRDRLERIGIKLNIIFLEDNLYKMYEQKKAYDMIWLTVNPEKNHLDTFVNQFSGITPSSIMNSSNPSLIEEYIKKEHLLIFMDYIQYIWIIYREDRIQFPLSKISGINVMDNGYSVLKVDKNGIQEK